MKNMDNISNEYLNKKELISIIKHSFKEINGEISIVGCLYEYYTESNPLLKMKTDNLLKMMNEAKSKSDGEFKKFLSKDFDETWETL